MLAKNVRATRLSRQRAFSLTSIASKLAPTKASRTRNKNKSETTELSWL